MSNIFLTIDKIKALLNNKALILPEKKFLERLLHGNEYQLGLIQLAQYATPNSFKTLEQEILTHLSSVAPTKHSYRVSIQSIYKDIVLFRELTEDIAKSQKMAASSKAFTRYAKLLDKIYHATCNQYNGVIMLPILQRMDYRLGNSKGECSGYVAEWIQSFLNDKRPFGVSYLADPPFQPISLTSNIGKKYPELNHCAPLTKNIAYLQKLNFRFTSKGLDHTTKGTIYQQNEGGVVFKHDASLLAQYLLNLSNQNPNCGFYLSLRNYTNGHALGFYKDKLGNLHFLDVNTGWYRFHNEADFTSWFSFYFNTMKYHKKYDGCELFSFGFQKKKASMFNTILNTGSFFVKRESYLLEQRLTEPFRFFNHPKPSQKDMQDLSLSQNIHSKLEIM